MVFRFRALSYENEFVKFKLTDCPNILNSTTFFLNKIFKSPKLYLPAMRGHPTEDIFEGDYVYDKNTDELLGIVIYNNGFGWTKISEDFKESLTMDHIYLKEGDSNSLKLLCSKTVTPTLFRYIRGNPYIFRMNEIVCAEGDVLDILQSRRNNKARFSELSCLCCITEDGEKLFEGDFYNNKIVDIYIS